MIAQNYLLGDLVDEVNIRAKSLDSQDQLQFFGVSNERGIIPTKYSAEDKLGEYKLVEKGYFAYNPYRINVGSIGLVSEDVRGLVSPAYVVFKVKPNLILPELLLRFLKSDEGIRQIKMNARGTVRQALRFKDLCKLELSIPAYQDQQAINDHQNDIASVCDKLRSSLNKQEILVSDLRQAVLREAMQGKLVPQDPSDEPASELLKRIKAEKAQLIKEKKLKPGKELPPIKPEEIPYPIPDNWIWCRLGDVFTTITKGSSPKWQGVSYAKNRDDGVLFITSKNVREYTLDLSEKTYVDKRFNDIEPRSILKRGDFLTNIVGASIGRTAYFDLEEQANINQAVCILRKGHQFVNDKYLLYIMNSNLIVSQMLRAQFAPGRANLSMGNLSSFVIPLPPQEEQNRISMQLNLAYHECNSLLNSLYVSEEYTTLLQDSIMNKALGLM